MAQKQAKGSKNAGSRPAKKEPTPSRFSGQDVLHVVLIGLVCTVLFAGIGIAISMSKGITAGTGTGGNGQIVASNDTPVPTIPPTATATEIPCEAQAWWDTISAASATVINNVQALSVKLPPQQIKAGSDTSNAWKTSLEAATNLPPCVQSAQQALLNAANETGTLYGFYLTVSEQKDRGQQFLRTMDSYLVVTDELQKLNVTVSEDWFTTVRDFTLSDCPVKRWFIEQFVVRDYKKFFEIMDAIDPRTTTAGDLNADLITMRSLRSSLTADSPGFPDCVQPAVQHLSSGMDSLIQAINLGLGGDMNGMSNNLVTFQSEVTSFGTELDKLDSTLLGPGVGEL